MSSIGLPAAARTTLNGTESSEDQSGDVPPLPPLVPGAQEASRGVGGAPVAGSMSGLASYFASCRDAGSNNSRETAALADVADEVLRDMHESSEGAKPCPTQLAAGFPARDRAEIISWLVETFEAVGLTDSLFFSTVYLLDRYYATTPHEEMKNGDGRKKLLAAVLIVLKVASRENEVKMCLREVVCKTLGGNKVSWRGILAAELAIFAKLGFSVEMPTARDFLKVQTIRILDCDRQSRGLAEYLLQLTIVDARLHYRHPHSLLAASALTLALFATRAPQEAYRTIIEDLVSMLPDCSNPTHRLLSCCQDLHRLWLQCASGERGGGEGYIRALGAKFASAALGSASRIEPPAMPLLAFPPHAALHEALAVVRVSLLATSGPAAHDDGGGGCGVAGDVPELPSSRSRLAAAPSPRSRQAWVTDLHTKLRKASRASRRVQKILATHSWDQDGFRQTPDRRQLLSDLACAARVAEPAGAIDAECGSTRSRCSRAPSSASTAVPASASSALSSPACSTAAKTPGAERAPSRGALPDERLLRASGAMFRCPSLAARAAAAAAMCPTFAGACPSAHAGRRSDDRRRHARSAGAVASRPARSYDQRSLRAAAAALGKGEGGGMALTSAAFSASRRQRSTAAAELLLKRSVVERA